MKELDKKVQQVVISFMEGDKKFKTPLLITFVGLPGAGKSHIARKIAKQYPFQYAAADNIRVALCPEQTHCETEHKQTYASLYGITEKLLKEGKSVIIDATMPQKKYRDELQKLFHSQAKIIFLFVQSPRELVIQRLLERNEDFNDPTAIQFKGELSYLERFEKELEIPTETEGDHFFSITNTNEKSLQQNLLPLYTLLNSYIA